MPGPLHASLLLLLGLAACSGEQVRGAPDVTLPRIGLVGAPPPAEHDSAWSCEGVPLGSDAPAMPTWMPRLRESVGRNVIQDSGVLYETESKVEEEPDPDDPNRHR